MEIKRPINATGPIGRGLVILLTMVPTKIDKRVHPLGSIEAE